jgi:hypothetical protein
LPFSSAVSSIGPYRTSFAWTRGRLMINDFSIARGDRTRASSAAGLARSFEAVARFPPEGRRAMNSNDIRPTLSATPRS